MRSALNAAIDRQFAEMITTRLRRAWPMLKLVPASWLTLIVAPAARGLRRSLFRDAVAVVGLAGVLVVVIALVNR